MRTILFIIATTACVFSQDQPLIRVGTRLVEVDVAVRNAQGAVGDLRKTDFTLLDKGKPQDIAIFSISSVQGGRKTSLPLPDGAVSNRVDRKGEEAVSATVVLFDRLNTASEDQAYARDQLLRYLGSVEAGDRMALYSMNKTLRVIQDFTDDPQRLIRAAQAASAEQSVDLGALDLVGELSSTGDEITDAMQENAVKEMQDRAYENRAEITAYFLQLIGKHLQGFPGRKKLVWITGGFPARYSEQRSRVKTTQIEMRDFSRYIEKAVHALNDANVGVYPIDPRPPTTAAFFNPGIDTMNLIAGGTGGYAQYVINDITAAIGKAVNDTEVTYVLGFYPNDVKLDGSYHPLKVKVAREGIQVRHRQGYFASETKPPAEKERITSLSSAFQNPLAETGLSLTATTEPLSGQGGHELAIVLQVPELHLEREKENWVALITIATQFPPKPQPNGTREDIKLTFTEKRLREVLNNGYLIRRPFDPGGRMGELNVVVQDRVTGELGSVKVPVR